MLFPLLHNSCRLPVGGLDSRLPVTPGDALRDTEFVFISSIRLSCTAAFSLYSGFFFLHIAALSVSLFSYSSPFPPPTYLHVDRLITSRCPYGQVYLRFSFPFYLMP